MRRIKYIFFYVLIIAGLLYAASIIYMTYTTPEPSIAYDEVLPYEYVRCLVLIFCAVPLIGLLAFLVRTDLRGRK
jgi:hypothetical protein